jgi:hypothetical protein
MCHNLPGQCMIQRLACVQSSLPCPKYIALCLSIERKYFFSESCEASLDCCCSSWRCTFVAGPPSSPNHRGATLRHMGALHAGLHQVNAAIPGAARGNNASWCSASPLECICCCQNGVRARRSGRSAHIVRDTPQRDAAPTAGRRCSQRLCLCAALESDFCVVLCRGLPVGSQAAACSSRSRRLRMCAGFYCLQAREPLTLHPHTRIVRHTPYECI